MVLSLDPEVATAMAPVIKAMASMPPLAPGDVPGRRQRAAGGLGAMIESLPDQPTVKRTDHPVTTSDGATINVAEFRKIGTAKPAKAILYLHGGGFIFGSVDLFAKGIAANVARTGVTTFAVGYRLAPENPHPIPVTDCFNALQWLSAHSDELGVDPGRIILMGTSAGGGLAAGTALLARDQGLNPPLAKQILIYPMLDDVNLTPLPGIEPLATWKVNDNITGWGALLGDKAGSSDPKAVSEYAAAARAENLEGLPPTYIECGQLDIFIFDDMKYATRLAEARVPVELHTYPGQPHAFQIYAPQATYSKLSNENVDRAIALV